MQNINNACVICLDR